MYADPLRWMISIPSLWHEATFRNYAHSVATQKELISSIASWQNIWHFILSSFASGSPRFWKIDLSWRCPRKMCCYVTQSSSHDLLEKSLVVYLDHHKKVWKDMILLMAEILHELIGSLSHYLQGFTPWGFLPSTAWKLWNPILSIHRPSGFKRYTVGAAGSVEISGAGRLCGHCWAPRPDARVTKGLPAKIVDISFFVSVLDVSSKVVKFWVSFLSFF